MKGNEVENTMQANNLHLYTSTYPQLGSKGQNIFLKVLSHIKIKRKKCRSLCKSDLMQTPGLWDWVKRSDIESVQISIF